LWSKPSYNLIRRKILVGNYEMTGYLGITK
jgi:hypothetical protein